MTASRWKYAIEPVTVGENTQNVRKMTSGERRDFMLTSKRIKAGEMEAADLPFFIAKCGCTNPTMTEEEAREMPPDLLDACVRKITELSGMRAPTDADDETSEKKDPANS